MHAEHRPALLAGDVDRIARFRREAQILATLNHPHVAAIHALEEDNGVLGLVLELVEGPTLADRLASGSLPVDEALRVGRQTAEALEAAHAKGIVHRDFKPANIKTAAGGSPSLLLKVGEERGERFYRHPAFLPSGNAVLFTIGMADTYSYDDAQIGVLSLESGQKTILIEGGSSVRYSPSGHLMYAREGKLLAVPFRCLLARICIRACRRMDGN